MATIAKTLDDLLAHHIDDIEERQAVVGQILRLMDKKLIGRSPKELTLVALANETQRQLLYRGTNDAAAT